MQLSQGIINGRSHRLMQQNGQDFVITGQSTAGFSFGIVLDGCGGKYRDSSGVVPSQNGVGANLLGQYAAQFIKIQLPTMTNHESVDAFLAQLYRACITYLDCLTQLFPWQSDAERQRFIYSRLLCTLVGFVATPETAVCFWSGDGYLCINDEIIPLESNNRPDYLAYHLLNCEGNGRHAFAGASCFNTLTIHNRKQLNWLAVATDGWNSDLLTQLAPVRTSLSLQRWINIQARQRGNFDDDGAVAKVELRGS